MQIVNFSSDRYHKMKLIRLALLAIVFAVTALILHYFFSTTTGNLKTKKEGIEKALNVKENIVHEISGKIHSLSNEINSFSEIHRLIPGKLWDDNGIILFVFKHDSLIYWSGNEVELVPEVVRQETSKELLHFGNGWFRKVNSQRDDRRVLAFILIKHDYPYQNEYLKNEFQKDFNLPSRVSLDTVPGHVNINDRSGNLIFSLEFPEQKEHQDKYDMVVFLMLSASLIFFMVLLFYLYHLFDFFRNRPLLLFLAFLADVMLLRILLLVIKIPAFIYQTDLFSPYYYATSFFAPSLGDFFINSYMLLTVSWLFYHRIILRYDSLETIRKIVAGIIVMAIITGLYYLLLSTMKKLIIDSSFGLNFNNIFNIDLIGILGFVAISCQFLAFFLVTSKLACSLLQMKISSRIIIVTAGISALISFLLFTRSEPYSFSLVYSGLLIVYWISFLYFARKATGYRNISGALFYIVLFSLTGTFVLDYNQEIKEKEKRKIIAAELSTKRDPMMEFEYRRIYPDLMADTLLQALISGTTSGNVDEIRIQEYLRNNYFNEIWDNYEQQITLCSRDEILEIQPTGYLVDCYEYFNDVLLTNKADSIGKGLYFFNNRSENNNYIAVLEFRNNPLIPDPDTRIFIELYYKYIKETGLGYPDLLIDKRVKMISGLSNYSYSRYLNESLVYKYGDFSYHLSLKPYYHADGSSYFVDNEGYNHYVSKLDEENVLIISKKKPGILDLIAPFSYLFILFSVFLLVFILLVIFPGRNEKMEVNFSTQLQLSIIIIIVISFFVLGVITRARIIHLNQDKNGDILSEKTFSVLTELEHKIGNEPYISPEMTDYLGELLQKFSMIFYSDINLFDPQGNLIVSSRPQIFEEGLLSGRMNTEAYQRLAFEHNLLFIQNEKIGLQEYLSAYIPFRNNNDQIIAYLNLPYFAKQTEIRKELSDFLVAYINVYVLLIVLAIMVTIIVSRLITRPLHLIREKLSGIGLGKANEKIEWDRNDEIGGLIMEYNRMVDELARSAELLASSERESAWREMAKQVAHEIKNPLTPMKLSVQYLKKAWDENAPDWNIRLERFSRTIIEQIDSLSQIASEFSDFAKMPVARLEKMIELSGIVKDAVNLYKDIDNIHFVESCSERSHFVEADKRQLLRVFNNLIQNAVQAIGDRSDGRIEIGMILVNNFHVITVKDNGSGISAEQAAKMFTPSFTTKSSGMGLGLAMVKSIITSIGGTITFHSVPGDGATF